MRKYYVIGNLKMNLLTREEVRQYLSVLQREANGKRFDNVVGVLCPSFPHLSLFDTLPTELKKGAQDVFWEKEGAYTSQVSPATLRDEGVEYVIIGHSERRQWVGESDEIVRQKMLAALKFHLLPIVCIGETKGERQADHTDKVLAQQVKSFFTGLAKLQAEKVIIAYEPRWAVGTDIVPASVELLQVRVLLRKLLTELFDAQTAERIVVVYGGSVKSAFLPIVVWEAGMDGVLVGRESLFPYELFKMMQACEDEAKKGIAA